VQKQNVNKHFSNTDQYQHYWRNINASTEPAHTQHGIIYV